MAGDTAGKETKPDVRFFSVLFICPNPIDSVYVAALRITMKAGSYIKWSNMGL
jgi:hypothetical protein